MTLLGVRELSAFYGDFQALFGVSLDVAEGETVAVIGANGAGKSTFLRAVAGALPVPREAVRFDGQPVGGLPSPALVDLGLVLVPEGRKIFPSLSVHENLLVGAYRGRPGPWTAGSNALRRGAPAYRCDLGEPASCHVQICLRFSTIAANFSYSASLTP